MTTTMPSKQLSIAPMIDWTDSHFRYLLRLMSKKVWLYTDMITPQALLFGASEVRRLRFHTSEHPLVLQLGGSDPLLLQKAARMGAEAGFDEINLNVGCPSPRVTRGAFGVCLMREPDLVVRCLDAMRQAVSIPINVKCRIGVDHDDTYEFLHHFVTTLTKGGCDTFIVHARKAWLKGLSPKQNREIPPLQYETVCQLKRDFPRLTIIINGGFKTTESIAAYLKKLDGCMIGRIVCDNPYFLSEAASILFGEKPRDRRAIFYDYLTYMESQLCEGVKLARMARFLLNFFHGVKGAAEWRRYLSREMHQPWCTVNTIENGLMLLSHY